MIKSQTWLCLTTFTIIFIDGLWVCVHHTLLNSKAGHKKCMGMQKVSVRLFQTGSWELPVVLGWEISQTALSFACLYNLSDYLCECCKWLKKWDSHTGTSASFSPGFVTTSNRSSHSSRHKQRACPASATWSTNILRQSTNTSSKTSVLLIAWWDCVLV